MSRTALALALALATSIGFQLGELGATDAHAAETAGRSYLMMTATKPTALAKRYQIALDFGEEPRGLFADARLRDEATGKVAKFNTVVDAMNWLADQGWEHEGGYVLGAASANPTYVFIFAQ